MIKKIELENFESHEFSSLTFHPKINVIIGDSDQGKTSIRRALTWIKDNRPLGDSKISDWILDKKDNIKNDKTHRVSLSVEDNIISRFRTKNSNGYKINEEKPLEALNKEVPKKITSFLNLSEVNIQDQINSIFLLGKSPGQIGSFLNSLVNLDEIDQWISAIDSKKRENTKNLKNIEIDINELEIKLKSMNWLEKAEEKFNILEEIEKEFNQKKEKFNILSDSLLTYKTNQIKLKKLNWIKKAENILIELKSLESTLTSFTYDFNRFYSSISDYKKNEKTLNNLIPIKKVENLLQKLLNITQILGNNQKALHKLNNTLTGYRLYQGIIKKCLSFSNLEKITKKLIKYLDRIKLKENEKKSVKDSIKLYNTNKDSLKNNSNLIKQLLKSLPEICPTCKGTGKLK